MAQATVTRDLGVRIGVIVRRNREHKGLTQAELAKKAGVTQAEISYIERGKRAHLKTLDGVSQALDMRFSDMVRRAEDIGDMKTVLRQTREFLKKAGNKLDAKTKASAKEQRKSTRLATAR